MTLSIKGLSVTLSVTALCHYAECGFLFIGMLSVTVLYVVMPNVIMLSAVRPLEIYEPLQSLSLAVKNFAY